MACRLFKWHESRYFVCLWSTHSLILANIICDNVSAVLVFLVRYMHKLSISSLSSYLRHDISDLRLPKRPPIRDSKSHSLSMMLQSETWSSSSLGVQSRSRRFGDSWYCEEDELQERVTRWFRLDICLLMIIWSKCVYIAASVTFRLNGSERFFFHDFPPSCFPQSLSRLFKCLFSFLPVGKSSKWFAWLLPCFLS